MARKYQITAEVKKGWQAWFNQFNYKIKDDRK